MIPTLLGFPRFPTKNSPPSFPLPLVGRSSLPALSNRIFLSEVVSHEHDAMWNNLNDWTGDSRPRPPTCLAFADGGENGLASSSRYLAYGDENGAVVVTDASVALPESLLRDGEDGARLHPSVSAFFRAHG